MSGFVGNLSQDQEAALAKFMQEVEEGKESAPDDHTALQFLRARKFDVTQAAQQYCKSQAWRREHNIDYEFKHPDTELMTLARMVTPSNADLFDKEGRPVFFCDHGSTVINAVYRYIPVRLNLRVHRWEMENFQQRCRLQSEKLGKRIETGVNVFDIGNLSMQHGGLRAYVQAISAMDEANYPECLTKTFIINAPWIFKSMWGIIKGFLDPVVAAKVEIMDGEYKEALLQYIDADQLPVQYGGTSPVEVKAAKEEEVMKWLEEREAKMTFETATVAAGKVFEKALMVDSAGGRAELTWYFTADSDVQFEVVATGPTGGARSVVTKEKVSAHTQAQWGQAWLEESDLMVTVRFDNTNSMFSSKTVKYNFNIKAPVDQAAEGVKNL